MRQREDPGRFKGVSDEFSSYVRMNFHAFGRSDDMGPNGLDGSAHLFIGCINRAVFIDRVPSKPIAGRPLKQLQTDTTGIEDKNS